MKSIIIGVSTAIVSVAALAVPASATFNQGTGQGYVGGNASLSSSGYSRIGIKDGKIIFEGVSVTCVKSNAVVGGMFTMGGQAVNQTTPTLPSADTSNCAPEQVVNTPTPNSTVTINGVCDEDAAKLKAHVTGTNVTVIVNGTGPCKDDDKQPIIIKEVVKNPETTAPKAEQASAQTPADPKSGAGSAELPETGNSEVIAAVVATVLAASAYAGTRAIRAFRA